MIAFLQTYGFWLILIALFILMMRMYGGHGGHGMGGCCGMGGMEHDQQDQFAHYHHGTAEPKSDDEPSRVVPYAENPYYAVSYTNQQDQPRVRELPPEEDAERIDGELIVARQTFRER